MVQPQVFPVYFSSSPPPSQPAPVIPVGAFPAVSLSQSPIQVPSPFVPRKSGKGRRGEGGDWMGV